MKFAAYVLFALIAFDAYAVYDCTNQSCKYCESQLRCTSYKIEDDKYQFYCNDGIPRRANRNQAGTGHGCSGGGAGYSCSCEKYSGGHWLCLNVSFGDDFLSQTACAVASIPCLTKPDMSECRDWCKQRFEKAMTFEGNTDAAGFAGTCTINASTVIRPASNACPSGYFDLTCVSAFQYSVSNDAKGTANTYCQ